MAEPGPERIAVQFGLDLTEIGRQFQDAHLPHVRDLIHPWRDTFCYLLSPVDLDDIDTENNGRSEQEKRLACLRKWKTKHGAKATYYALIDALLQAKNVDGAEKLCVVLRQSSVENKNPEQAGKFGL